VAERHTEISASRETNSIFLIYAVQLAGVVGREREDISRHRKSFHRDTSRDRNL
jgi:hypothetical protein